MTNPNTFSTSTNKRDNPNFVDWDTLEWVSAKVKFYDPSEGKKFGFLTLLNKDGTPMLNERGEPKDAFINGFVLQKAGYERLETDSILKIKHRLRVKGEAVVVLESKTEAERRTGYSSNNHEDIDPPSKESWGN